VRQRRDGAAITGVASLLRDLDLIGCSGRASSADADGIAVTAYHRGIALSRRTRWTMMSINAAAVRRFSTEARSSLSSYAGMMLRRCHADNAPNCARRSASPFV